MPRLSYGKAVGLAALWGLLSALVLTMISGARELMTPGAWEKKGATYQLVDEARSKRPQERRERLELLKAALWKYADAHEGRFPPTQADPEIEAILWKAPDPSGMTYFYITGRDKTANAAAAARLRAGPVRRRSARTLRGRRHPHYDVRRHHPGFGGETMIDRIVTGTIAGLILLLLVASALFEPAEALVIGWYRVLARVGPQIEISYAGVVTALVCIGATAYVLHLVARWFYAELRVKPTRIDWPAAWRWKWTLCLVASVMLMFGAGLAGVGVWRTTSWFLANG